MVSEPFQNSGTRLALKSAGLGSLNHLVRSKMIIATSTQETAREKSAAGGGFRPKISLALEEYVKLNVVGGGDLPPG